MLEDKLLHDERVRLEALSQAVAFQMNKPQNISSDVVVKIADLFETFIKEGKR